MKFSVSSNTLLNSLQRTTIRENYSDNIIFEWLNFPCIKYCSPDGLLLQEDLFLLCFQFLDYIKQFDNFSDPKLQNKLRCIPYEANNLLDYDKYNGYAWQCDTEKLMILMALYALADLSNMQPFKENNKPIAEAFLHETPDPFQTLLTDLGNIMLRDLDEWEPLAKDVFESFTDESPFFQRSKQIIQQNKPLYAKETHIAEYIKDYLKSPQRLSELIQNEVNNATDDDDNLDELNDDYELNELNDDNDAPDYEQQQQQLQQLQQLLQEKDNELTELRKLVNEEPAEEVGIKINSTYKCKIVVLLSAMHKARYFQGIGKTDRDNVLIYILKHGFGYSSKCISQTISQYKQNGGNLDKIKFELSEALGDLTKI